MALLSKDRNKEIHDTQQHTPLGLDTLESHRMDSDVSMRALHTM